MATARVMHLCVDLFEYILEPIETRMAHGSQLLPSTSSGIHRIYLVSLSNVGLWKAILIYFFRLKPTIYVELVGLASGLWSRLWIDRTRFTFVNKDSHLCSTHVHTQTTPLIYWTTQHKLCVRSSIICAKLCVCQLIWELSHTFWLCGIKLNSEGLCAELVPALRPQFTFGHMHTTNKQTINIVIWLRLPIA